MKKKIILAGLCALMLVPLGACDLGGDSSSSDDPVDNSGVTVQHDYVKQDAVSATCETAGNEEYYTCNDCDAIFDADKKEITAVPVIEALGHEYVLTTATAGTCATKGTVAHYTCGNGCGKLFDLSQEEITSAEGDYDATNHESATLLSAQAQPSKLTYKVGETFDPTGMVITYKCEKCDGEIVDNNFLTYTYQTDGAQAFTLGDTKIIVNFNGLSFEVAVTVEKMQAEISGMEAEYTTSCGVAPTVNATCNIPDADIVIEYYDGADKVEATDMLAGKTYSVKISFAETDAMLGAEVTATVSVEHKYSWVADEEDPNKLIYACGCGDAKDYYAMNNQVLYVDDADMSIDLSKVIKGTENYSIKSVRQIQLLNNNEKVAIEGENADMVYTFGVEKYEKLTEEWTPYFLALSVVYTVDGVDCEVTFTAKYVEKVIRTAEDLLSLAYTGGDKLENNGFAVTGQYVLAGDIDASGLTLNAANHAWQAAIGFQGVFEGNGYTIRNLTVPAWQNGLFGAIGFGKIQNVNFENVVVGEGGNLFALVIRNATMKNVSVEFNVESVSYNLANSANDCEFENVTILTEKGKVPFLIGENAENAMPETITFEYFTQYTVMFDTDGGSAIDPVAVTVGKTVAKPTDPTKASDDNYDYTFAGWLLDGAEFNFDTPITKDIELVAQWTSTERLNESELIVMATNAIAALPESVTMPADLRYLSAISSADALYNELSDDGKAQVSNASKLETLLAASKGYTAIYTPDANGVKAIPAVMHNNNASVGVTGALATDDAQGTIFISTAGENGKAAIQFVNFPSVVGYDKIYFYVRSNVSGYLYMSDDTANDGWGTNWANNSATITQYPITKDAWTLMSLDVSTNIITGDWAMSVWNTDNINKTLEIGVIVGCRTSDLPTVEKSEVTLNFGARTDSGETNEYGKVYNISREQYYIDTNNTGTMGTLQTNTLANALPAGYDHFEFWIYNPTETDQTFHLAGDVSGTWTDSADFTTLKAKSWTKVTISNADIQLNAQGQWYVYIGNADAAGWQISTIYAVKA